MEYPKILNLFKRDDSTHKLGHEYTHPAFEWLAHMVWRGTEKVDGMNMRVQYDPLSREVRFMGRTKNAQIPVPLDMHMREVFTTEALKDVDAFLGRQEREFTLFGEGYGAGIQKPAGSYYNPVAQKFILFDVWDGQKWLQYESVQALGETIGVPTVPLVFTGDLYEAADFVAKGFDSAISVIPQKAEGLVLRPRYNLCFNYGERVQVKMKTRDYAVRV